MSENATDFVCALKALGRPVAYYPVIAKSLDSINCAVFLSQLMYWEGKQEDEDGWIRKPYKEVQNETGLGRYELESVRKKLNTLKILEEDLAGIPARIHYRVNWDLLNKIINKSIHGAKQVKKIRKPSPVGKEKVPTILFQMKDAYLAQRKIYHPEAEEYNWTKKDWNFMKLTKNMLEKRALDAAQKKDPLVVIIPDSEILERWIKYLSMIPEFYAQNQYFPSSLFTNFSAISQAIVTSKTKNGNKGINFAEAANSPT